MWCSSLYTYYIYIELFILVYAILLLLFYYLVFFFLLLFSASCLVFKKGGDKLTLSLNGGIASSEETKQSLDDQSISETSVSKDDRKRCATPVTVTHFSFGECGKLEQRVISPERSPTESMSSILSLPFNPTSPTSPRNPFSANPFTGDSQTTTNPFLSSLSNPFTDNSTKNDSTNGIVVSVVESTDTNGIANPDTKIAQKIQVCYFIFICLYIVVL